jgi:hypothetical protein
MGSKPPVLSSPLGLKAPEQADDLGMPAGDYAGRGSAFRSHLWIRTLAEAPGWLPRGHESCEMERSRTFCGADIHLRSLSRRSSHMALCPACAAAWKGPLHRRRGRRRPLREEKLGDRPAIPERRQVEESSLFDSPEVHVGSAPNEDIADLRCPLGTA